MVNVTKQRIRKLRRELDLTQQEFAEKIGVSRANIGKYETGISDPSAAVLSLICREFNVNEEWLKTGAGEMFKAAPSSALDALAEEYKLSAASYVMVEKFVNLKPEAQEAIFNYLREVVAAFQSGEVEPEAPAVPAADLRGLSIDEKVALYRSELEREEKAEGSSEASRHGA